MCSDASCLCPSGFRDSKDIAAIAMELLHYLGELAGLVQISYIPARYSRLLFRVQGIHCQGVSSLLSLAVIHHQSRCLAWLASFSSPPMFATLALVFVTRRFYGIGLLAPCPTLLFYQDYPRFEVSGSQIRPRFSKWRQTSNLQIVQTMVKIKTMRKTLLQGRMKLFSLALSIHICLCEILYYSGFVGKQMKLHSCAFECHPW